jgi:hypothetical protein
MARYQPMRQNLIEAAEAMPEGSYGFRPVASESSFKERIGHLAMDNMRFCKFIMGPTESHQWDSIYIGSKKSDVVKALRDSFEFCDAALTYMNDAKALAEITVVGKRVHPVDSMIGLVARDNEYYGNLVAYLLSASISPPAPIQ